MRLPRLRCSGFTIQCTGLGLILCFFFYKEQDFGMNPASTVVRRSPNLNNSNVRKAEEENSTTSRRQIMMSSLPNHHVTSEAEFAVRRRRYQSACAKYDIPGDIGGVFTAPKSDLLYCFIPKTGCTFWKLFFLAVRLKQPLTLDSIFGNSRTEVHLSKDAFGRRYDAELHSVSKYSQVKTFSLNGISIDGC